jgi:hypothetical protein
MDRGAACSVSRCIEGMSPDDAINQYMGFGRLWSPTTVYAAQHELCLNTLPPS